MSACTRGFGGRGLDQRFPNLAPYADVRDVAKAAQDWPQLNFIIYHSGFRHIGNDPAEALAEFERTGRLAWVSDLADIPGREGVTNVYGDLGQIFASDADRGAAARVRRRSWAFW